MPLNKELPIAISMGEPGGINIEIILKCIKKKLPAFFLIADPEWAAKSIKFLNSSTKINIIENIDNTVVNTGTFEYFINVRRKSIICCWGNALIIIHVDKETIAPKLDDTIPNPLILS